MTNYKLSLLKNKARQTNAFVTCLTGETAFSFNMTRNTFETDFNEFASFVEQVIDNDYFNVYEKNAIHYNGVYATIRIFGVENK